jgi:FKBP-type peptidyl-prolyl cis-trans isomerase (trigger factor)
MLSSYETYASYYGIELEEFVSYYGYELDDFYSLLQENAELQVKSDILYRYIAQKEGITATEEDYLEMVQEYMDSTGYTDMAEFVNAYGADVVEEQGYADATLKKVMDFCYQNAVLHVTSAEETTEAAE